MPGTPKVSKKISAILALFEKGFRLASVINTLWSWGEILSSE